MFKPSKTEILIFNDSDRSLTNKFSDQDFLKVNLENLALTWFKLVKMVRY